MAIDWMALATVIGFPALASARRTSMATFAGHDVQLPMPPVAMPETGPAIVAKTDDAAASTVARLPRAPAIDADEAVRRFILEMIDEEGGCTIPFADLHSCYAAARQSRRTSGWPAISSKAFALRLRALGCERVQVDMRDQGQGRPVCYVIPETMEALMTDAA